MREIITEMIASVTMPVKTPIPACTISSILKPQFISADGSGTKFPGPGIVKGTGSFAFVELIVADVEDELEEVELEALELVPELDCQAFVNPVTIPW